MADVKKTGSALAESAGEGPDGPFAGDAQRKSEREAVARIVDPEPFVWLDRGKYVATARLHADEALAKADQILALVREAPDAGRQGDGAGWQTIDSAPRDGTRVDLLYSEDIGDIGVFRDARWRDDLGWSRAFLTSDGDLFYTTYPNAKPTHWRPAESGAGVCQGSAADTAQGTLPPTDHPSPNPPVKVEKSDGGE